MTWLVVVAAFLFFLGLVAQAHRAITATNTKVIDASKTKQITFEHLANKRHNIHTAQNIIALGLVRRARQPLDRTIQNAYDGLFERPGTWAAQVVRFYGLDPDSKNFVGH